MFEAQAKGEQLGIEVLVAGGEAGGETNQAKTETQAVADAIVRINEPVQKASAAALYKAHEAEEEATVTEHPTHMQLPSQTTTRTT